MSGTPYQVGRAPVLGEHNEDVYADMLGLSTEEMSGLREAKVI